MTFDPQKNVRNLGKRLVADFVEADEAEHAGIKGTVKETGTRRQLEKLLPGSVSIGTGKVIDSFGGESRQLDIVIYEKLCPVFSLADTPEANYYPVEGVVATGEVKSTLSKAKLEEAFENVKSVKSLVRLAATEEGLGHQVVPFRKYNSSITITGTPVEQFDQARNQYDQVYSFVLGGKFSALPDTTLKNVTSLISDHGREVVPNVCGALENGFIVPTIRGREIQHSFMVGDTATFCDDPDEVFPHLIRALRRQIINGRTVPVSYFEKYFLPPDGTRLSVGQSRPLLGES